VPTSRIVPLGHFHSPQAYSGEWRCDTHPRFSPDGTKVVIDSPHGGNGRQLYLIDVSGIVPSP
jgi:Tol biopolymer transport system component